MMEKIKNFTIIFLIGSFLILFPLWGIIQSNQKESISERRPLTQFPKITKESVLSAKKAFATLNFFCKKDNNHLYLENVFISKLDYPINI